MEFILFLVLLSLGVDFVLLGATKAFAYFLKCRYGYVLPKLYGRLVVLPFIVWFVVFVVPPLMASFGY